MARPETWDNLRYFKKVGPDKWGDPDLFPDHLLYLIDEVRHGLELPIYITSGTGGNHLPNSYHHRGLALDWVCPGYSGNPIDLLFYVMRFPFSGIGFYPYWTFQGKPCFGIHTDVRPLGINRRATRWMRIKKEDGKQEYIALSYPNILKYGNKG